MSNTTPRPQRKAIEAHRAALAKLAHAKEHGGQLQYQAMQAAGVTPEQWHPACDTRVKMIAEAEIEVAETSAEVDRACVEAGGLRASLAEATRDCQAKLAAIVDPPTPTIESTPEAKEEFDRATAARNEELAANAAERRQILQDGLRDFEKRRAADGSDFISRAKTALAAIEAKLADVTDSPPPVLGDASVPSVVDGLARALDSHRATLKANESLRAETIDTYRTLVAAIVTGHRQLSARRREAGLPSSSLFQREPAVVPGYTNTDDILLRAEIVPFTLAKALEAIGPAVVSCDGPRIVLSECRQRREAWEQRQAEKSAKAAKGKAVSA